MPGIVKGKFFYVRPGRDSFRKKLTAWMNRQRPSAIAVLPWLTG